MRLAELFHNSRLFTEQSGKEQEMPVQNLQLYQQIKALVPGQTIQGEIVSRSGNEMVIRLADDLLLNARLEQNMQLDIGKILTFEVRNNGKALTLSPLFSNLTSDANILRALDMANLPTSQKTVTMTGQMMEAGLSVDRNSLQNVYRQIQTFRADSSNVVDLHKLGLPVNENTLEQVEAYKEFHHQIVQGMDEMIMALTENLEDLSKGDENHLSTGAKLLSEVLHLLQEEAFPLEKEQDTGIKSQSIDTMHINNSFAEMPLVADQQTVSVYTGTNEENATIETILRLVEGLGNENAQNIEENLEKEITKLFKYSVDVNNWEAIQSDNTKNIDTENIDTDNINTENINTEKINIESVNIDGNHQIGTIPVNRNILIQLVALLEEGIKGDKEVLLKHLLSHKDVKEFLGQQIRNLFLLEPKDLYEPKKVEEFYKDIDRQLRGLIKILEVNGQEQTNLYRVTSSLSKNLDFLHQVNQMYSYVQLPLKLQQGKAHGDLYVYTNRKNLSQKDGEVSALLHLDMEHLGPVDVYVKMQFEKVSTKFYVQNDDMLTFLNDHMDILTERLRKRGYDMTARMEIKGNQSDEKTDKGAIAPLLQSKEQGTLIQRFAFDVRA